MPTETALRCPFCSVTKTHSTSFCPHCGAALTMTPTTVGLGRLGGARKPASWSEGAPPSPPPDRLSTPKPPRSARPADRASPRCRQTAFWLALLPLFFGGVGGIHHFYTGRILFGILQLMTAGGLFVWAIVDAVHISQGRFLDAEGRPLLA